MSKQLRHRDANAQGPDKVTAAIADPSAAPPLLPGSPTANPVPVCTVHANAQDPDRSPTLLKGHLLEQPNPDSDMLKCLGSRTGTRPAWLPRPHYHEYTILSALPCLPLRQLASSKHAHLMSDLHENTAGSPAINTDDPIAERWSIWSIPQRRSLSSGLGPTPLSVNHWADDGNRPPGTEYPLAVIDPFVLYPLIEQRSTSYKAARVNQNLSTAPTSLGVNHRAPLVQIARHQASLAVNHRASLGIDPDWYAQSSATSRHGKRACSGPPL
ncbi:hypothetical protein DFH08DRAFT_828306 [Mycena albidolilacea]|uniref:Uncharacterized protein n=1 Tax=Mycena albidolilacea TaxID=1033008 RepID=A0AAD6YWC3_9AGAR|nr:hypothetical protein DFH08DRAFT_828306 [Mycena albidolilacea]